MAAKNCPPLTHGRVYNFSAGPSTLPEPVLLQVQKELLNYQGVGYGVMEMSHRSKEFIALTQKSEKDLRELCNIPANYKVLFLQGGGLGEFSAVPMNMGAVGEDKVVDYVVTGNWSERAHEEAQKYCKANICASSKVGKAFPRGCPVSEWKLSKDAIYTYYCENETVHGVEYQCPVNLPEGKILCCDMSSNFLSRPFNCSNYGLIFAGAQKNIGPAGVTVVIIRSDLLGKAHKYTPQCLDFKVQSDNESMKNTPPCFAWYVSGVNFDWIKGQGGLTEMQRRHNYMADKLYGYLDDNKKVWKCFVEKEWRSHMNVPFAFANKELAAPDKEALEKAFLKEATAAGLTNLGGYKTMGGFRASLYNGMPTEGADHLVQFMKEFQDKHADKLGN